MAACAELRKHRGRVQKKTRKPARSISEAPDLPDVEFHYETGLFSARTGGTKRDFTRQTSPGAEAT